MRYTILFIFISLLLASGCAKRSLPPEESIKVQLITPVDEVVTSLSDGLDWATFPGADAYIFKLWGVVESDARLTAETRSSIYRPSAELQDGAYRWAVGVADGGDGKHWSDTASFHLSQRVVLSSPQNDAIINDLRVYFDWLNFPFANGYRIIVWREGEEDQPVFDSYEFTSSVKATVPFFEGDYRWTVAVKYAQEDSFGRWSDTLSFTVFQYPYRLVNTLGTRGYPREIYPHGDYLYIGDGSAGLLTCDRSDRTRPIPLGWDEPIGQYESRAIWIDEISELMVVADYRGNPPVLWYDVSNPARPVQTNWAGLFARRSQDVDGTRFRDTLFVVIADYDDGAFLYDLHDTSDQFVTLRGSVSPNGFTYGVALHDSLLFVAAEQKGVFISRILAANSPIAWIDTPGEAQKIAIQGHYCFVADAIAGLTIIDFANPRSPSIVGRADVQVGSAQDVKVEGNYCFVANGSGGTLIYDVSNPAIPIPVQEIDGLYSYSLTPEGNILYIADRDWGILTLTR